MRTSKIFLKNLKKCLTFARACAIIISERERKIPNTRKEKKMTVREVMEVMAQWDPDAVVVPCDWDEVVAIRAFRADGRGYQLRWEVPEEEEED